MAYKQSDIRHNLLLVYSQHEISDIDDALISAIFLGKAVNEKEEIQKVMEELARQNVYLTIKMQLEEYKKYIEKELIKPHVFTSEQQLTTILFEVVLNRAISFSYDNDPNNYNYKMQLLYDLIKYQFIDTDLWIPKLAKHYDVVFPILKDWYSFFFSYTNKQAFDINKRYEPILPLGNISTQSNQVARLIAEKLCQESLPKAFIDEKEIEYGADFKEKIDHAIEISCSFVQMVSNESFHKIGATNWCQYEFDKYKAFLEHAKTMYSNHYYDALKQNFFFLIMGSDLEKLKPAYLIEEYRNWYSQIQVTNHLKFYTHDYNSFQSTIRDLAIAIIQAKKKLIDAIPQ